MAAPATMAVSADAQRMRQRIEWQRIEWLRIDMAHLALLVHGPAGDAVAHEVARDPPLGDHRVARPLHVAGVVGGAALQDRGPAVPAPGQLETHQRLWQDLRLDRGFRPALAAVGRHFDLPDHAAAAPGP